MASISIRIAYDDPANVRRKLEELGRGDKDIERLAAAFAKVPPAAAGAGGAIGRSGDQIRQIGFQVQDLAVQIQGGQSPFVALSQQGGQLAQALLGPQAALGVTIGLIGAMIAKNLLFADSVEKVSEAEKKLADALEATNKVLLSREQQDFLQRQKQVAEASKGVSAELEKAWQDLARVEERASALDARAERIRQRMAGGRGTAADQRVLDQIGRERADLDLETRRQAVRELGDALVRLNTLSEQFPEDAEKAREAARKWSEEQGDAVRKALQAEAQRVQAQEGVLAGMREELQLARLTNEQREAALARRKAEAAVLQARGIKPGEPLDTVPPEILDAAKKAGDLAEQRVRTEQSLKKEEEERRRQAKAWYAEQEAADKAELQAAQAIARESAARIQAQADAAAETTRSAAEAERLLAAERLGADAVREVQTELAIENSLRKLGLTIEEDKGKEIAANIRRERAASDERQKIVDAVRRQEEEARRAAELMTEPFKNALRGIQDSFTDFFQDVLEGGVDSFDDLAASAKRIFTRLAAELISLQLFSGGGGLFNLLGAAGGVGAGAGIINTGSGMPFLPGTPGFVPGASAGGLSGLLSPGNALGLAGLLTSGFNVMSQAQAAVLLNSIGLGGSSFLSAGLSSGLNASPFGFIGSLGAQFLGPMIGVNTGGLGGMLGGGAGSFLGGALGGALLPGVGAVPGAILGGFLGSIGGGFVDDLFGGGGGMSEQEYWANVNFYNQQAQFLKAQAQGAAPYNAYLGRGRRAAGGGPVTTQVGQALASASAEFEQMRAQAEQLQFALGPLEEAFASLTQRIKDDFVRGVDDARLAIEDPGGAARRGLDAQAKLLRAEAADAGVGSAEVEALIAAQAKKARDDLDSGLAVALAQFTGDARASFDALLKQQAERARQVESLGADMARAEQLSASERVAYFRQLTDAQREALEAQLTAVQQLELATAELLNQAATTATDGARSLAQLAEATRSFGESVDALNKSLATSALSPYSTATKYQLARAQYEQTLAAAEGGDVEAMGRYASDRQAFLELSRALFGGSDQYQIDFARTLAEGEAIVAGAPGVAEAIEAAGKDYSKLAERVVGAMTDATVRRAEAEPLLGESGTLRGTLVRLTGEGGEAVAALDELIGKLQEMADVTKGGAIAGVASAAAGAQASYDQLQNWLRYAEANAGDANALQHALAQATAVRQGLAGNVATAAGLLPDTWDDAGAAADYAAAQGLYGQQSGLVERIAALLEQRRAEDAAAAAAAAQASAASSAAGEDQVLAFMRALFGPDVPAALAGMPGTEAGMAAQWARSGDRNAIISRYGDAGLRALTGAGLLNQVDVAPTLTDFAAAYNYVPIGASPVDRGAGTLGIGGDQGGVGGQSGHGGAFGGLSSLGLMENAIGQMGALSLNFGTVKSLVGMMATPPEDMEKALADLGIIDDKGLTDMGKAIAASVASLGISVGSLGLIGLSSLAPNATPEQVAAAINQSIEQNGLMATIAGLANVASQIGVQDIADLFQDPHPDFSTLQAYKNAVGYIASKIGEVAGSSGVGPAGGHAGLGGTSESTGHSPGDPDSTGGGVGGTGTGGGAFAAGGWVTGGIPGRDSVRSWLMPDEFVVRAAQARRYGPLLEAINDDRPMPEIGAGRRVGTDAGVLRELRALRGDVTRLTEAVHRFAQESGLQMNEQTETIRQQAARRRIVGGRGSSG